ncbi:MAG: ThiF family adenylyltransferase [Armatimonadetes bacterium]|nr:ThiF family adenylyltransferase [Armatimonadota bacterium]
MRSEPSELAVGRESGAEISRERQEIIPGWDQEAIEETVVAVLCEERNRSPLAELVALGASAMGCRVVLARFSADRSLFGSPLPNPPTCVPAGQYGLVFCLTGAGADGFSYLPDGLQLVVVDGTMTAPGHALAIHLGMLTDADAIVCAAGSGEEWRVVAGAPWVVRESMTTAFDISDDSGRPSPGMALLLAGIMLEAIRLAAFELPGDSPLALPLRFRALSVSPPEPAFQEAVLVGAGGIGAAAAWALRHLVGQLHVYDDDVAEPSNRARAPWLISGQSKVHALADTLGPSIVPHFERITEPDVFRRHPQAEFVFAAVDNVQARETLSQAVVRAWTPESPAIMVNTGCSPQGALAHFVGGPRKAACMACRRAGALGAVPERQSCSAAPVASVIHTNWIAAGLGVLLLEAMAARRRPADRKVVYDCSSPRRFLARGDATCQCFT